MKGLLLFVLLFSVASCSGDGDNKNNPDMFVLPPDYYSLDLKGDDYIEVTVPSGYAIAKWSNYALRIYVKPREATQSSNTIVSMKSVKGKEFMNLNYRKSGAIEFESRYAKDDPYGIDLDYNEWNGFEVSRISHVPDGTENPYSYTIRKLSVDDFKNPTSVKEKKDGLEGYKVINEFSPYGDMKIKVYPNGLVSNLSLCFDSPLHFPWNGKYPEMNCEHVDLLTYNGFSFILKEKYPSPKYFTTPGSSEPKPIKIEFKGTWSTDTPWYDYKY